jgi:transposase
VGKATSRKSKQRRGPVLDVLKELLAEGRNEAVVELVEKLVARNSELEQRLTEIGARRKKNEGISRSQLLLFLDALATAAKSESGTDEERDEANRKLRSAAGVDEEAQRDAETQETKEPRRQPPLRQAPPAHLRRIDNPLSVPAAERACPRCGAERKCIGHDVTEVIELIPAEVVVRRDCREKLACSSCEGELVRAPPGDKVVAGGKLGSRLVAQLVVDKYWDGLPLHRQKGRFERMGLAISVSTLADQVTWSTDLLRPLWRGAIASVLTANVMHLDGTSLPVVDREAPGGKRIGTLWGYVGDRETALYLYASTGKKEGQRKGEIGPEDMLKLRSGYTVADAATIFDSSFKREGITECGCNMHARRYFVKALDAGDTRAALPLAAYKKLYKIEDETKTVAPEVRQAERQTRSKPVFDELVAWAKVHQPHEPPASAMGVALRYLTNHHLALARFLEDGVIPIDNGVVERLHVRAALTRKNFLFAGSDAGGERAAIAYTILGCCQLAGVDPVEYLADVLPHLSRRVRLRDLPALLPASWKAAREAASPDAAA